jgi:long-chain acyl-CoA synthetase
MQSSDLALLGQTVEQVLDSLPPRISSAVWQWASSRPSVIAIRDQHGHDCSHAELATRVRSASDWLRQQGVGAGDRVLLVNENCLGLLVLILALSEVDAISVVVNARLSAAELARIQQHCEPRLALYLVEGSAAAAHWAALAAQDGAAEAQLDGTRLGVFAPRTPGIPLQESALPVQQRVCVMIYTTGTTGDPKGVMLTHRNLLYVAALTSALRGMQPGDRVYGVLPVSHIFGLAAVFLGVLHRGASVVLDDRFDPARLFHTLHEQHITGLLGVPTMFARLLEHARAAGITSDSLPRLRYAYAGGAPLDPTIKAQTEALLGIPLLNGYGMTESGPTICQVRFDERLPHCGVGRPLPGLEIRLRDAAGRDVAPGDVGELHVRGPGVMRGYFRNPEATAAAIAADGFLNTGDLARQDPDGQVHIVGRSKELIIHSGFNVYPPEVEAAIARHPEVVFCAVIGRPVAGNEEVVACVQTTAGSTLDEPRLQDFIRAQLAPYKRPSRILFMSLPTAPSGKVLKHRLAALVANS